MHAQTTPLLSNRQFGQSPPEAATPTSRCNKEHYNRAPLDTDPSDGPFPVPSDSQTSNRRKGLPHHGD